MNRKGVFFSLTALLVIGALIFTYGQPPVRGTGAAETIRVQELTQDRDVLEGTLLPIILREYVRRELDNIAIANYQAASSGQELPHKNLADVRTRINDCLRADSEKHETDGKTGEESNCEGAETEFANELHAVVERYEEYLQYDVRIALNSMNVTQVSPWNLYVTGNFSLNITDSVDYVRYNRDKLISTEVPITGLVDPYASELRGELHRVVREDAINWTLDSFAVHAHTGSYVFRNNTPSYTQRLLLDTSGGSPIGIFSLLPPAQLNDGQNAPDFDQASYNASCVAEINAIEPSTYLTGPYLAFYRLDESSWTGYNELQCERDST